MSDQIRRACLPCKVCMIKPHLRLDMDRELWMLICKDKKHRHVVYGLTTLQAVLVWNREFGDSGTVGIKQVP